MYMYVPTRCLGTCSYLVEVSDLGSFLARFLLVEGRRAAEVGGGAEEEEGVMNYRYRLSAESLGCLSQAARR